MSTSHAFAAATPGTTRGIHRALVVGFGSAIAVWVAWFVTHLPWLSIGERECLIAILAAWAIALGVLIVAYRVHRPVDAAFSGLICASTGLLLIGTKIAPPANASAPNAGVVPAAWLVVIGFLAVGGALGLIAWGATRPVTRPPAPGSDTPERWLARFALMACAAVIPLLLIGGLVTSTDSGMAVPDWPNTFGSNMLLYPLGPRVAAAVGKPYWQVYLEHSHRLFGMLIGLTTVVLAAWVLVREPRRWVRALAGALLLAVCVQGLLGGLRVTENSRYFALVHGFLAHLIFGSAVALAVVLSPTYVSGTFGSLDPSEARRLRRFATALLHLMILQVLMGAGYRHLRSNHVLFTHLALSLVVVVLAIVAGAVCSTAAHRCGSARPTMERLGRALLVVTILQFMLGFYAWLLGGKTLQPATALEVLPRTLHQGTGALLIALCAATYVWVRRIAPRTLASGG